MELASTKTPSLSDCIQVLRQISRRRIPLGVDDEAIQIQTLRLLEEMFRISATPQDRRKLAKLRLWTSQGWKDERPVFATDDETLSDGLADRLPIWQPGGELGQFRSLMKPLRVEEIRSSSAEVVEPDSAQDDLDGRSSSEQRFSSFRKISCATNRGSCKLWSSGGTSSANSGSRSTQTSWLVCWLLIVGSTERCIAMYP